MYRNTARIIKLYATASVESVKPRSVNDKNRDEGGGKLRVCVIGAGAAGLCALRHLAKDPDNFEFEAFEQFDHLGGTWVYTQHTGVDEKTLLPIHSSMYQNLRTNVPGEFMNFPDWRKTGETNRSCISHEEVLAYLDNYARHFRLHRYITFNSKVETVRPIDHPTIPGREIWKVKMKNMHNSDTEEKDFDAVMCCNGHCSEPNVPAIPGIETFPGQVLHSHDYRKPEPFAGKTVVILGASSSGGDIGIDLCSYAEHVYLSHNTPRLVSELPVNMTEKLGVSGIEGRRIIFKDGSSVTADVFIYCTGYKYSFPFLHESCGVSVDENYVYPLYRHLINAEHPTMCFVGIPALVVAFAMFDVQVRYFLATLKGVATLPSRETMLEDSVSKTALKRHAHRLTESQWDYNDLLARDGGFDPFPPIYKTGYYAWKSQRSRNLVNYQDAKFIVADDGKSVQIVLNDKILIEYNNNQDNL
ncbi:flavin-containing monooxygenase FMO GS-OX5-like [Athalia rosae]|uniref:flavin-containing monooxygenase FMO GS-OX5-like n=1 Tax=Athalia rosae TaxID=37344 RepID=UPI0020337F8E|nr:flavin-containing monooxygenase FMO GS-OX5-like [Athalia rosae]